MNLPAEHLSLAGRALLDRRGFLSHSATALGSIALANMLGIDGLLAAETRASPPEVATKERAVSEINAHRRAVGFPTLGCEIESAAHVEVVLNERRRGCGGQRVAPPCAALGRAAYTRRFTSRLRGGIPQGPAA